MADGSFFWTALKWIFLSPFKLIALLFKLKLRHTLVGIFLIVMFISSVGEAIQQRNIGYFFLGMGRVILGADQNISKVIVDLANAERITWAGHSWLVFNMLGSLYLIGYIIYYMQTGFSYFNKDMPIVLTILIYFILFFAFKMLYLSWEGSITKEPYDLGKASNWADAIPFKFIYDFVINFDKLYSHIEPIVNNVKNFTEPYTGILNKTEGGIQNVSNTTG